MAEPPDGWWTSYFDEVFLRVYRPFLGREYTSPEIYAIRELLPLPTRKKILDVGCGWGRHAIPLAGEGYDVTGLDLSSHLLAAARRGAAEAGVEVEWIRADMREIPLSDTFDGALSLFSSLGYFPSDTEDARVLHGVRSALKGGGVLLIETMHRDLIAREFAERDWWETPEGDLVWVEREFDAVNGISREALHWRAADGSTGIKQHTVRVRSASEWRDLLAACGFEPVDWFGSWDLDPFTHASERLIILARAE